jgi:hypothetical protein
MNRDEKNAFIEAFLSNSGEQFQPEKVFMFLTQLNAGVDANSLVREFGGEMYTLTTDALGVWEAARDFGGV